MGFPESAHIPVYLTSLVGRAQELSEVAGALHAHRLVSLVGAGGSGKSRLAAAVATELRNCYGRDIAWVDLAPLSEPGRVASHVAAGLGLREQAGRALPDSLVEGIGRRDVLLVLDNCEHLVAPCGSLVDMLLRGCPALRVLVTSRQALAVEGEKAWQVPPLALPMPGDPRAAATGAVQLFVQRARDVLPGLALCARRGVTVLAYEDEASGTLEVHSGDGGKFVEITLHPVVTISEDSDEALALELHHPAHERCFIANSCSVPIRYEATIRTAAASTPKASPEP